MRQKMESINYSSENQEPQRPEHDDLAGIGRSYDCVYCKRGFNTAQALGGHMNIHRKDRAARNPKPNNLNDTTSFNPNQPAASLDDGRENNNNNNTILNVPMYFLHQVSTGDSYPPPPPPYHHHQASQMSYRTHFPATTSAPVFADHHYYRYNTLDCDDGDGDGNNPQCLNLFENDWRVSLSLRHVDGVENIDDGVDLELRLGHDR